MTITAAADGSALGNPGPNGWAWYIDDSRWAAGGSPHGTNNQGELQAVLELLRATAGTDEKLVIQCDSKYVIDSITKWMPGWKRRGWRKADGGQVLNRELMEALDEAMQGRNVTFEWVKGHAGHHLNEMADERANAAAKAYQAKVEPRRGPGFAGASDAGAAIAGSAPVAASVTPASAAADSGAASGAASTKRVTTPPKDAPRWAEPTDLFAAFEDPVTVEPITLTVTLTADEHARLIDRADAQGIALDEALRRLI